MLKAINLKKTYKPKKGQEVKALDDVSIEFEEKGLVFILGKSGSGKSTLLNVLGGLDTYDEGIIEVKGKSSKDFSQSDFDSYRNTFIGFIFQDYNILDGYTVEKNIGLALELQGKKADKKAIEELMDKVDLKGYGKRKPNTLSGGQKQRVAIARALIKNPEIIMADEPTGALDSNTGKQVFDTLKKLSQEKLIIVVSHDREFAELYGDRVIELADGKIISDIYKYKTAPKVTDGLEIVDDKVLTIKKGTVLDSTKLNEINEFLKSKNEDIIISTDKDANVKFKSFARIDDEGNKESFKETEDSDLELKEYDPKQFKLIRSKLPFKDSFKMGASGLNSKKFRLFLTILLSSIAFALFGLADTMASYNKVSNTIKSISDSPEIKVATFQKEVEMQGGSSKYWTSTKMNDQDVKALEDNLGKAGKILPVYMFPNWDSVYLSENFYTNEYSMEDKYTFGRYIYGFTEAKDISMVEDFCVEKGSAKIIGRYPSSDDEIMISGYIADSFVEFGYKTSDASHSNNNVSNISNREELLGKTINCINRNFKIVGIFNTGFDASKYSELNNRTGYTMKTTLLDAQFKDSVQYGADGLAFLNNGFYSRNLEGNSKTYIEYNVYGNDVWFNGVDKYRGYDNNVFFDKNKTSLSGNEALISYDKLVFNVEDIASKYNISQNSLRYYELKNNYNSVLYDHLNYYLEDNKTSYPELYSYYSLHGNSSFELLDAYAFVDYNLDLNISKSKWSNISSHSDINGNETLKSEFESLLNDAFSDFPASFQMDMYAFEQIGMTEIENYYNEYKTRTGNDKTLDDFFKNIDYYQEEEFFAVKTKYCIQYAASKLNIVNEEMKLHGDFDRKYDIRVVGVVVSNNYIIISDQIYEDALQYGNTEQNNPYKYCIFKFDGQTDISKAVKLSYNDKSFTTSNGQRQAYRLRNSVMSNFDFVNDLVEILAGVFLYVGIGFAVFAALLLMNFISISISYKKREIGILRAIGARGFDVFKIFFNEALIIAIINFVIAIVLAFLVCMLLNNVVRSNTGLQMTLLNIGLRQVGLMLAISILVAALSSAIPVSRVAHKKPIDAIRNSNN